MTINTDFHLNIFQEFLNQLDDQEMTLSYAQQYEAFQEIKFLWR
jgi:hypothetical protein